MVERGSVAAACAIIIANWQTSNDKGAGNGQRVEMARRYFGNGSEAEKGWRKRGRVLVYWPGKKGRGVVLWWVMEEPV